MKSILVYIDEYDGLDARLQLALDVARVFDAHLTCIAVAPFNAAAIAAPYGGMFGGAYAYSAFTEVVKQTQDVLQKRVETHLQKEDVRWDYMRTTDDPVRAILGLGAISDLIVMSAASDGHAGSDPALLGRILVASQTPVMIAPAKHQVFEPSRPALVAWDGSYEAANALRGAMPFLRLASSVTLLTINEHSGREMPPLDAAEYLARHGVASEVASLNVRDKSITQVIQQESADMGAGVVVMGAYGQSRVREYWFGGVTREMLEYVDIPLLMAH